MALRGPVGDRRVARREALAEEAGMTLDEYEEFIFDAVLLDWDAEGERMRADRRRCSTRPTRCGS